MPVFEPYLSMQPINTKNCTLPALSMKGSAGGEARIVMMAIRVKGEGGYLNLGEVKGEIKLPPVD